MGGFFRSDFAFRTRESFADHSSFGNCFFSLEFLCVSFAFIQCVYTCVIQEQTYSDLRGIEAGWGSPIAAVDTESDEDDDVQIVEQSVEPPTVVDISDDEQKVFL